MKLLLDQGLPRTAATELGALGWDVVHIGAIGMATATDQEILRGALVEQRVVVTLDADFHTILALENEAAPSVIRVRIEGLRGVELAALIQRVVQVCEADLVAPSYAMAVAAPPPFARDFVEETLTLARNGEVEEVAASFLLGREDLVPAMFRRLLPMIASSTETESLRL